MKLISCAILFFLTCSTAGAIAAYTPETGLLGADHAYYEAKGKHGLDAKSANIKVKQLLHAVQLGLERFAVDNPTGNYPDSIDQLVQQRYLIQGLYINPVTSVNGDVPNARDVPFGWSDVAPGNFTYLKRYDGSGGVTGYALVGYGASLESAGVADFNADGTHDGTIILLASGLATHAGPTEYMSHGELVTIVFGK